MLKSKLKFFIGRMSSSPFKKFKTKINFTKNLFYFPPLPLPLLNKKPQRHEKFYFVPFCDRTKNKLIK